MPEAQEQVVQEVATGQFRTAAAIREWITQTDQADNTVGGISTLLKRPGG
jgi:hypothetical protein